MKTRQSLNDSALRQLSINAVYVETTMTTKSRNIVFFHPDLGIGGAERLIVDAAVGLQELGHKVVIFTSHCDPRHCFEEARDGQSYANA